MGAKIESIDFLIHPWWSAIFEDVPYWDRRNGGFISNSLKPVNDQAQPRDYFHLISYQWKTRFMEAAQDDSRIVALLWAHGLPSHDGVEQELLQIGQENIGDRFIDRRNKEPLNHFYHRIVERLASPWLRRLPKKMVVHAYGEKSTDCVPRFSHGLARHMGNRGVETEVSILRYICSDIPDGKEDAYRSYLDTLPK